VLTVAGLTGLTVAQVVLVAPTVRADLHSGAVDALRRAGLPGVGVRVEGRDAILTGSVADARAALAAEDAVRTVQGFRFVDASALRLTNAAPAGLPAATPTADPAATATRLTAVADQGRVLVAGALPDAATARGVRARLVGTFGNANVTVSAVTVPDAGTAGVDALVAALVALGPTADAVAVTLAGDRVEIAAAVTDPAVRAAALAAVRRAVPNPADVVDRVALGNGAATADQVGNQLDSLPPLAYPGDTLEPGPVDRSLLDAVGFVLTARSRVAVTFVGVGPADRERGRLAESYLADRGIARNRISYRGVAAGDPAMSGTDDAPGRPLVVEAG
jgi:hypothetical protein